MCVHANIEPLIWESEFFALATGKLLFADNAPQLNATQLDDYALVQARVPTNQLDVVDALTHFGFSLAEGEMDLVMHFHPQRPPSLADKARTQGWQITVAQARDIASLRAVAEKVFALSRFRAPWYDVKDSCRFYALWIEKAVLGTFDHECLLLTDNAGNPLGFVTLRLLATAEVRIGLLAAYPGVARKGVGTALMAAARQWSLEHQVYTLRVATQSSNLAALRLYLRCGATIDSAAYWLYRGRP